MTNDARMWDTNQRDPSYLYRQARLGVIDEAAARWADSPNRYPPLPSASAAFLRAARYAARRATRRRRAFIASLLAVALIAVVAAGIAARNAGLAARSASKATRQHAIALSRQLAAESLTLDSTDPVTARQLAAAAWRVFPTSQASAAIGTLLVEQQQNGVLPVDSAGVHGVAFSRGWQAAGQRWQRRQGAVVGSGHRPAHRAPPSGPMRRRAKLS